MTDVPPPEDRDSKPLSYRDAGVDIDAGNELVERIKPAVRRTLRPEVMTGLGGFGGLFDLSASGYRDPVLVSGTDGVGTKLMLARLLGRHDTIGIDLVAMCVNDILTCGAEPLFFLDYFATGRLDVTHATAVVEGIATGCHESGCALIGGETAEMPGMYGDGEYDLAGFAVGAVERDAIIDGSDVAEGHHLIGLSSSGPHSNGYSLIRKVLQRSGADPDSPLGDATLGEALLAPTRLYVKPILSLLSQGGINGMAHVTGGGITENIVRVIPDGLGIDVDLGAWQWPDVFQWIQSEGRIDEAEMLRTFNCGIGFVLVVNPDHGEAIFEAAANAGLGPVALGNVTTAAGGSRVRYRRD